MITIGTAVLFLLAGFALWRGRPMVAGAVIVVALASTSGGSAAMASAQTVSTQLGASGQSLWSAFIK